MPDPTSPSDAASAAGGTSTAPAGPHATDFFGHPRGLSTLFFTELWERFSYYGMRALLILFMVAPVTAGGLGFDVAKAGAVYGLYTGSVYLMALPGGWVADRVLGLRSAVLVGGVLIALGHFSMAVPTMATFYLGLGLIVLGTGLLKPNVSSMVGELYPEGGARRDAGFSIFYMGINIGAFIAPLVCGFLGQKIDWHLGFAAAGIGMVLGVTQYVIGDKYLGDVGRLEEDRGANASRGRARNQLFLGLGAVGGLLALLLYLNVTGAVSISFQDVANAGTIIIVSLAALYFGYVFLAGGLNAIETRRVAVIGLLFIFSAIFWSGFEQAGSSLNLVAEQFTDLDLMGWIMPASWLQSVNALFIIALAPVFAWLWVALGKREPSSPAKFSLGLVLLGLGFLAMAIATAGPLAGAELSPAWLVLTYFLHTTGELCLSPVGLSTVTKLAPRRMAGQMMGIWFMSISLGNLIAGQLVGLYDAFPEPERLSPLLRPFAAFLVELFGGQSLPQLFGLVFLTTAGAGLVLALVIKPVRKLMSGVH